MTFRILPLLLIAACGTTPKSFEMEVQRETCQFLMDCGEDLPDVDESSMSACVEDIDDVIVDLDDADAQEDRGCIFDADEAESCLAEIRETADTCEIEWLDLFLSCDGVWDCDG